MTEDDFVRVREVRAETRTDSDDVAVARPRLSWITESARPNWRQARAELMLDDTQRAVVVGRESVLVAWPFDALVPRRTAEIRVRVTGEDGITSPWSEPRRIFPAFLTAGEWSASFIGLPDPATVAEPALLRTEFEVDRPLARATLYATAQGAYQVEVNGREVDDQVLKPGWTTYEQRLIHETTDVTPLVTFGANAIGVTIAGAWFTENYGFRGEAKPHYGLQPAVALQLFLEFEDGSRRTVATGPGWSSTGDGPIVASGIYAGETYDARLEMPGWSKPGFDDSEWRRCRVVDESALIPEARTSPAVRVIESLAVAQELRSPSGGLIFDFGQNLVGRLRVRVHGTAGTVVTVRHAEVLEDGELGLRPLRYAKATDSYTIKGDENEVWEPRFTFHGFRYAQIDGVEIAASDVTANVIHSDMRRTGWFESSHALLNQLHANVVWGMRGNFLYVPTDCPQRDERLGWTGDIQVFSPTASFLYDSDAFLASWLVDLQLEQERIGDGTVPFVVPSVLRKGSVPAAAWGDAATVVPTVLHERFGDLGVVERQFDSMKAWATKLVELSGNRFVWEGDFQFGDWLDPTAPPDDAAAAKTDPDIVASAYLYRSVDLVAKAARMLGRSADAEHFSLLRARIHDAFGREFVTGSGRMTSESQTSYALAIAFGLYDSPEQRDTMGERLAGLVKANDHRIGTGFVGTPIVADALVETGHLDTAARLLTQTSNPSWLYPVTMGATTIWERWDSMLEDGSINPGSMTSFNHYAFGAVADWLHRTVAGLAPSEAGYRELRIAPRPIDQLDHASVRHETPYGLAEVGWRRDDQTITISATVPANTTAVLAFPGLVAETVGSGHHEWAVETHRASDDDRSAPGS